MKFLSGMNPALRNIIICVATFITVATLCIAALILSANVDPDTIINSIRRDALALEQRGDYPIVISQQREDALISFAMPKYRYDGFTDGIMLLQSIPNRNLNALENAVRAPYHAIGDGTPGGDGTGGISPTQALLEYTADPLNSEQNRSYVLYWHGYVVPLRILLSFMSPTNIITLNIVVFLLLAILVFEAFRRTGGWTYGIGFILALLVTFAWITPMGFQFYTAFLLAFLATLVLWWLLQSKHGRRLIMPFFLALGMLTAFFDFLTTPLLTFLLPLVLYILWITKKGRSASIPSLIAKGAAWLVGYAGFWAMKWVMTAIVYSAVYANSEFGYAIAQRSGSADGGLMYRFNAIYNNLYQLLSLAPDGSIFPGPFFMIFFVSLAALAMLWWMLVKRSNTSMTQAKHALPMLLVATGPYVWYFVLAQHSTFHSWMTYRLQIASVLALIFFVLLSVDWAQFGKKETVASEAVSVEEKTSSKARLKGESQPKLDDKSKDGDFNV